MDANQRSSINNQTNNGANEKDTPGATGKTAASNAPLDHTYPGALGSQQGNQQRDIMGSQGGDAQAIGGFSYDVSHGDDGTAIPGGSMETQVNGGSGTVQGVTDSHERQMQQKSGAYGLLEQQVGRRGRDDDRGTDVRPHGNRQSSASSPSSTSGGGMMGPGSTASMQSAQGSMGNRQSEGTTENRQRRFVSDGGGMPGPKRSDHGDQGGQEAQRGNTQLDVSGSRSMANQQSDVGGVHESNDMAGGLPRSPGNAGASSVDRTGSQTGADQQPEVHESNDASGGYPRSPGYANKLKGDQNMDDDTGFKRKP
jgi:hypothetical protein